MSFKESLRQGKLGELIVRDFLESQPWVRNVIDLRLDKVSQNEDVDFLLENRKRQFMKLEVKTDFVAHKTGNIAYEISTSNHVGCFDKTKAEVIAYYLPESGDLHMIAVKPLRKFVYSSHKQVVKMGDNAEGILLSIEDLKKFNIITHTFKEVY